MSDAGGEVERREVHFSGRVQGVGFRYTARNIARRHPIRGFVRNLPDGRVHLVAEGTSQALDRFVAAIVEEMDDYIEHKDESVRPATQEFDLFEVRH